MSENDRRFSQPDGGPDDEHPGDVDVPSLATALHSAPEDALDYHLGRGVVFQLGAPVRAQLEIYPHIVRVTAPTAQLAVLRGDCAVEGGPDGVVFEHPGHVFLAVGPAGEVLFQSWPPSPASATRATTTPDALPSHHDPHAPLPEPIPGARAPSSSPSPAPEARDKTKSERYVGRLGEVRTHRTKRGKLVAEVELTVADPERPGASQLVKFVAFGEKAETLQREYPPGQEVTAVGIPHDLQRRGKDGREWTERQLYFVQLPKPR